MHVVILEQDPQHTLELSRVLQQSATFTYQRTNLEQLLGNSPLELPESQVVLFCEAEQESEEFWKHLSAVRQQFPQWPIITYTRSWSPRRAFEHISRGAQESLSLSQFSLEQVRYVFSSAWIRHRREFSFRQRLRNHNELELSYRALFENTSDVIFISTPNGQLLDINQAGVELFGYPSKEELLSLNTEELYLDTAQRQRIQSQVEKEGSIQNVELSLKRRDGQVLFVSESANAVRNKQGEVIGYRGILRDITESKRRQQALRRSEERYAAALAGAQDGVWDWNLQTKRFFFSKRWQEIVHWSCDNNPDTINDWFSIVHPEDRELLQKALQAHLRGENESLEVEHRIEVEEKEPRWITVRGKLFRDPQGRPERMAGAIRDITEQKRREQRLRFTASHDILTALPNRALFAERLEQALEAFQKDASQQFAVLFLDLDGFKNVNDSFGHSTGDKLLMAISGRLQNCLRTHDLAARFGGDEFAVLVEEIDDLEGAIRVAERILEALKRPFRIERRVIQTNASIGIAMSHSSYNHVEEILRRADSSMYRAKREGKGRYCVVDLNQNPHATVQRLDWVQRSFPEAIEKHQLHFEWEPICHLGTGEITASALSVHWNHPTQGILSESEFLPLLKQAGMEAQWSDWWLQAFARLLLDLELLKKWPRVHFHLTEELLLHGTISKYLLETGLPMSHFVLDLSEQQVLERRHYRATLQELETLGLRFCLSDYGNGLMSLQELHSLPFSFVQTKPDLSTDTSRKVLRSIQALTTVLSAELILNEIDTKKTLEELRVLGYQWGKGKACNRASLL
jgi:diguanylate cyclase (GGDEF)-like protein/PAS domain S-box-containing protein